MKKHFLPATLAVLCGLPVATYAAEDPRQAEVAKLSADVMPFSLKATTHIFTKTSDGGRQRVVAKDASDVQQIQRVREHLHDMQAQFQKGDFSGPSHPWYRHAGPRPARGRKARQARHFVSGCG